MHTREGWRPTWRPKRMTQRERKDAAAKLFRDLLQRMADRAFLQVLGYVPAYKPGQSPEDRRTRRMYRKLSKAKGCGDAAAQAHASPAKNSKRARPGVGVKRRGGPTK